MSTVDVTTSRHLATFRPARDDLVDAGFLIVLGTIALIGFRTTYSGNNYLVVGVAGLLLGVVIAHIANIFKQPLIVLAVMAVAVFFLLGTAFAIRSKAQAGVLPTLASTRDLASVSVHGWKQLLTTLPPVAGTGPLLTIPYILGLVGGVGGFATARRLRSVVVPLLAPLGMLVAVLLLGTAEPAAQFLQGAVFAIVAFSWVSVRGLRLRPPVQNGVGRRSRVITAAALIGITVVIAAVIGPSLPSGGRERVVLRSYVTPPFDINAYPSPLVGYRKYTKSANNLWDQTLFTVKGLPSGDYIRIATLDDYNGAVWAATNSTAAAGPGLPTNSFQRVGTSIANNAQGTPITLRVTIAPGYAQSNDVNAWLPSAGTANSIEFVGRNSSGHSSVFVYNRATDQGIVPDRLQAGDTYVVHAVAGTTDRAQADPPANTAQPYGPPTINSAAAAFTAAQATKWSAGVNGTMPRVLAVANYLVDHGAFSDGGGDQSQYLPGHSLFRLSTNFLNDKQPVGDDEQYAAGFALLANQLGVPARVVVGAVPDANGVVRGKDVHTWVEVHLADGAWHSIPRTVFMPPVNKAPDKRLPDTVHDANASVIPPPNPVRPHSALDQAAQDDALSHSSNTTRSSGGFAIPGLVLAAFRWVGLPLLIVAAVCAVIVGLKARRRAQRRSSGPASTRVAQGWNEIVDHVRDFGAVLPVGRTRREQARLLEEYPVSDLAAQADATVFGPEVPSEERAEEYWVRIDETRRAISRDVTRRQRWRAAVSLRSFLPRPGRGGTPAT